MISSFNKDIWQQFGASIDMLENAIKSCPDSLWGSETNFWYWSYHCLFWLDYYMTEDPSTFAPPPPYTLSEFDPEGIIPEQVYSKEQLLEYLKMNREKCLQAISNRSEDQWQQRWINYYKDYSLFEITLYNLRHVQHHTAQLNLLLRQNIDEAPLWVSRAK